MKIPKSLTAVLIATLSFTLAACSTSDAPAPTTPTATQSDAPAEDAPAEDAPEAPAPAVIGDVITAEQAEALPAGQRAYTMADGSLVVIDDAAPLPEAVRAEMIAPIVAIGAQPPTTDHSETAIVKRKMAAAMAETAADGRAFYVVFPFLGDAGTFYSAFSSANEGKFLFDGVMSKDEAIRLAQEQADRINNAERRLGEFIEVIVL